MEKEKKKGKGKTIVIVLLILIVLGLVGYIVYDKVVYKYFDKKEVNEEKKNENEIVTNKKVVFVSQEGNNYYKVYEDGSSEIIAKLGLNDAEIYPVEPYIVDEENMYYFVKDGDKYILQSINLSNDEVEEYKVSLEDTPSSDGIAIENNKIYYLDYQNDNYVAVITDIDTGETSINKINLKDVSCESSNIKGKIMINDNPNMYGERNYYFYDFNTNKLNKIDTNGKIFGITEAGYSNDDILIYRENDEKYCMYDMEKGVDEYCINNDIINNNESDEDSEKIISNGNIYALNNNEVLKCTAENKCETIYELTPEEAKVESKRIFTLGDKIILALGEVTNQCKNGCTYSYKSFDITNNKTELNLPLGTEINLFYVR